MVFGGSEVPCAHGSLTSIGGLGTNNAAISKAVAAVLQEKLGVPPDRFYLAFNDVAGSDMVRARRGAVQPRPACALHLAGGADAGTHATAQGWNSGTF